MTHALWASGALHVAMIAVGASIYAPAEASWAKAAQGQVFIVSALHLRDSNASETDPAIAQVQEPSTPAPSPPVPADDAAETEHEISPRVPELETPERRDVETPADAIPVVVQSARAIHVAEKTGGLPEPRPKSVEAIDAESTVETSPPVPDVEPPADTATDAMQRLAAAESLPMPKPDRSGDATVSGRQSWQPGFETTPMPKYPRASRLRGEEGMVEIGVEISAIGTPGRAWVVRSSGFRRLDEAALKAIRLARFTPASLAGRDISARSTFTFRFELDE